MKRLTILLAIILSFGWNAAYAETSLPPECRVLPEHKASKGVAYQPGVDVRGKPVVPADVNADPMGLSGQTIVVPLTIDLAKRLQNQNVPGIGMEGTLGFLEVAPDGRVTYNGRDLTSQVHVLCGKGALDEVPAANGQKAPDALEYAPVSQPQKPPQPKPVAPAKLAPAPKPVTPPPAAGVPKKAEPAQQGELIEGQEYKEEGTE